MVIGFPDGVQRRLHELWRSRFLYAKHKYESERNEETMAAYKATLKLYADLVLRGKIPEEAAAGVLALGLNPQSTSGNRPNRRES
jgi:hypothetical protein